MKFRRLDSEELADLEKEFIRFLASNSVTGDDWLKIKEKTPEKAEELIDVFSDIVFEQTLKKVEYMEFKTQLDLKVFHCLPDKIKLMGLLIEGETKLDFTQNMPPDQMLSLLQQSGANLKMYSAEKSYSKERELELFDMMENGCLISKGELYKILEGMK